MGNPKQPLGITDKDVGADEALPVYKSDDGVETFITDDPYLASDGKSLFSALKVVVSESPIFIKSDGSPVNALPVTEVPNNNPDPEPPPYEPTLGPSDIIIEETGLESMGDIFELASPSMTLGVVSYFTGTLNAGEIHAEHSGEPLTLVRLEKSPTGVFTAIFYGNNLTVDASELRVYTTSETARMGPALMRMRDDLGYQDGIKPIWNDGQAVYSNRTKQLNPHCLATSTVLTAMGTLSYMEGATIIQTGNYPEMTPGMRGRVLSGEFEDVDNSTFQSEYWTQETDGVFTLNDAGDNRNMTIDVDIPPNVQTGLRFDYSAPSSGSVSVFYVRPNGTSVNMVVTRGNDRRGYLPIPPSTTGYVKLRFVASGTASIRDIKLIRNPFGVYGNFTLARGSRINADWGLYGLSLNSAWLTIGSVAIDGE